MVIAENNIFCPRHSDVRVG